MDKGKFNAFTEYVGKAFDEVAQEVTESAFASCDHIGEGELGKLVIIIGMTGQNKGRILLETSMETAVNITQAMNFGPLDDSMDLYFFMAEFANMFCGRAVTYINNEFRGSDIRLTPPAIFFGTELEITTPNIQSSVLCYSGALGDVKIDIGFEGV